MKSITGRKRDSPVWDYFRYDAVKKKSICLCLNSVILEDDKDEKPKRCRTELKGKNSSNLRTHLKCFHVEAFNVVVEKEMAKKGMAAVAEKFGGVVSSIGHQQTHATINFSSAVQSNSESESSLCAAEAMNFYNKDSNVYKDKLDALVKLFATTYLPTTLFDSPQFKEFLSVMDQQFKQPDRTDLESMVETLISKTRENIKDAIARTSIVSLSVDLWTKDGLKKSFMAVTCSFYNEQKGRGDHAMLRFACIIHPLSSNAIAAVLDSTLKTWDISNDKVAVLMTENGSNMITGIKCTNSSEIANKVGIKRVPGNEIDQQVADEYECGAGEEKLYFRYPISFEDKIIPCFSYSLQLVVQDLLEYKPYADLCSKTRTLVNKVKNSSIASQLLSEKCIFTLYSDYPGKWCSTYVMISRLIEIKEVFNKVLIQQELDSLKPNEWIKLELLKYIFTPFTHHVKMFESDTMSLSYMLPAVLDLEEHLNKCANISKLNDEVLEMSSVNFIKECSKILLESLSCHFSEIRNTMWTDDKIVPSVATFLDLRYNWILLLPTNSELLEMVKTFISKKLNIGNNQNVTNDSSFSNGCPSKRFKHLTSPSPPSPNQPNNPVARTEVDFELIKYIATLDSRRIAEDEEDSISAWNNQTDLPLLANFARSILALPSPQASVERLFSTCGTFTNDFHYKMTRNLEERVVLNYNLGIL